MNLARRAECVTDAIPRHRLFALAAGKQARKGNNEFN
jgi:hypothetical protein